MEVKIHFRKQEIHICIATKKLPVHFLPRIRVFVPGHWSNPTWWVSHVGHSHMAQLPAELPESTRWLRSVSVA